MQLVALSVYDSKAEFFAPPFYARTIADGKRSFLSACNDSDCHMSKSPGDFRLYIVGFFDDCSGILALQSPSELVCDGSVLIV